MTKALHITLIINVIQIWGMSGEGGTAERHNGGKQGKVGEKAERWGRVMAGIIHLIVTGPPELASGVNSLGGQFTC